MKGTAYLATIILLALAGCDSQPASERLELTMPNIKALCGAVGSKAWAESSLEDGLRKQMFVDGVKAECELEYRIKQQEAKKIF